MVVSPPSLVLAYDHLNQFIKGGQRQNQGGLIQQSGSCAHGQWGKPVRQQVIVKARMGEVFNQIPMRLPCGHVSDNPDRLSKMRVGGQGDIVGLSDPHFVNCVLILFGVTGSTCSASS